jgi:hypothetical protein
MMRARKVEERKTSIYDFVTLTNRVAADDETVHYCPTGEVVLGRATTSSGIVTAA